MKTTRTNWLMEKKVNIVIFKEEINDMSEKYVKHLFHDDRTVSSEMICKTGQNILTQEVPTATEELKTNKALRPDNVHAEFPKLLNEVVIKKLTNILNKLY